MRKLALVAQRGLKMRDGVADVSNGLLIPRRALARVILVGGLRAHSHTLPFRIGPAVVCAGLAVVSGWRWCQSGRNCGYGSCPALVTELLDQLCHLVPEVSFRLL